MKTCPNCNTEFEPAGNRKKFCSVHCCHNFTNRETMRRLRADPVRGKSIRARDTERIREWKQSYPMLYLAAKRKNCKRRAAGKGAAAIVEWEKQNPDKAAESAKRAKKKWRARNKDKCRIMKKVRESRLRSLPANFRALDWASALSHFSGCAYCGSRQGMMHQEHFVPVALGGGYTRDNIIPACAGCNLAKSDTSPEIWLSARPDGYSRLAAIWDYFRAV